MNKVKKKDKKIIYEILSGKVPHSIEAAYLGKNIKRLKEPSSIQPAILPPKEAEKNLPDYEISNQNSNGVENNSQEVNHKQQQKTSIINKIGKILFSIIKFPIVLITKLFTAILTIIKDSLNSKEYTSSKIEESYYLLDNEKYYPSKEYYPVEEFYSCEEYYQPEEFYLYKESTDKDIEKTKIVIGQDESIDTENSLKTKMHEQIKLYQATESYNQSRNQVVQISFKFTREKLFPIFYEIYKFNVELNNKGKQWIKKSLIFPADILKVSIYTLKKTEVLASLEQLYNTMFTNIVDSELQESIQQETPSTAISIINKTEKKIQVLFAKLFDETVTLRDYEQASNQYLALFEENNNEYDVDKTDLLHQLIKTFTNSKDFNIDEVTQQIKNIVIAFLAYNAGYSKQELDCYLSSNLVTELP